MPPQIPPRSGEPPRTPSLRFERRDGIAIATIDRPEKYNAIDVATSRALAQVVEHVEADDSLRVAILTAAGDKAFSTGADLEEVAAGRGEEIAAGTGGLGGLVHARRRKPWIAAVHGLAMGGGMELALACDLVVAGEGASFALPEVRHGLIAGAGGVYRIARTIAPMIAREMLLTGNSIGAARAYALGMVNVVVPDNEVLARAIGLAERIAANAPLAVEESLAIARQAFDHDETALRAMMDRASVRLLATEDLEEGVTAFLQKRKPQWKGR